MYILTIRYRDGSGSSDILAVFTTIEHAQAFADNDNRDPLEWRSNGRAGYPTHIASKHIYIISEVEVDPEN